MNLFKKIKENEEKKPATRAVLVRSAVATSFVLCALSLAVTAYVTTAWYSKNREVDSNDTQLNSDEAPTSLFISAGSGAIDKAWNVSLDYALDDCKLYPISTTNCSNWYYVSGWSRGSYNNGWSTAATAAGAKTLYASAFTAASVSVSNNVGTYTNTADGNVSKVAYAMDTYKVYTNKDSLNVYLNPTNPINITYEAAGQDLADAIRVGVVVDGSLKFIYAPVAETGHGNCYGVTTENAFYGVNSTTAATSAAVYVGSTGLANFMARTDNGNFTAGTTSLGAADDTDGLPITVYVWLEGTDAQAMVGHSDNVTTPLSVSVNLVGVEPST